MLSNGSQYPVYTRPCSYAIKVANYDALLRSPVIQILLVGKKAKDRPGAKKRKKKEKEKEKESEEKQRARDHSAYRNEFYFLNVETHANKMENSPQHSRSRPLDAL